MDMVKEIRDLMLNKALVSIGRANIDTRSIQGFVLACSDELVLIQYVYDFNLDGLMVLRVSDISSIKCSATNGFQKKLLMTEGVFDKIDFDYRFDVKDWGSVIVQLSSLYDLIIFEEESVEDSIFLIGKVQKILKADVSILYFDGVGAWYEKPTKLHFSKMICCQVGTNYLNVYQRHFERLKSAE